MKTKEELVFNAVHGVLAQGGRSIDAGVDCLYRGPNGRKCAIGHNIPDELYDPDFEQYNIADEDICKAAGIDTGDMNAKRLALELQNIHDSSLISATRFLGRSKAAADAYGVQLPPETWAEFEAMANAISEWDWQK